MNFASSTGRRGNFGDDFGSPSEGSYGNGRGSLKGEYGGGKGNRRGRDLRDFNGPRRHGSGDRHLGRLNNFLDMGRDRGGERPRRRVNVR
ncbi:hypothetical protein Nepgr_001562 [Nepenthes gracilis]|uniref:Uncharacterized protein n=1 Tax=Nepenthes gracilis TaxID=150966 RepID=A0AAD3P7D1_NEPGR|nr:hypothetical protein Nepgr_001562 [Nepenthes gracilis]